MTVLEREVQKSLTRLRGGALLLAAVSGGADSTALLAALVKLRKVPETEAPESESAGAGGVPQALHCVHVNHNLRGEESLADAHAVLELCERFGVPCHIETKPEGEIAKQAKETGEGIEAAARRARHEALRGAARRLGAEKILIAHTKTDRLENILIRLLRGAGPVGLALMPEESGEILRPLINLSRADILAYLDAEKLLYRTDSTNSDDRYLRNRVRLRLVPVLDRYFPDWQTNLERMAETQHFVSDHLSDEALTILNSAEQREEGALSIKNFSCFHQILREEIIFRAVDMLHQEPDPSFEPDLPQKKRFPPRRAAVRAAVTAKKTSDLAGASISFKDEAITIAVKKPRHSEAGFALVSEHEGKPCVVHCKKKQRGAIRHELSSPDLSSSPASKN
jgi:tRNA(Ile)-lysidine synthase